MSAQPNDELKWAKRIADAIGSPWGEGATYHSVFYADSPSFDIERESGRSHLKDEEWKLLVEDIMYLVQTSRTHTLQAISHHAAIPVKTLEQWVEDGVPSNE